MEVWDIPAGTFVRMSCIVKGERDYVGTVVRTLGGGFNFIHEGHENDPPQLIMYDCVDKVLKIGK